METLHNAQQAKADFAKNLGDIDGLTAQTSASVKTYLDNNKSTKEGVASGVEFELTTAKAAAGINTTKVATELGKIDSGFAGKVDAIQSAVKDQASAALNKALTEANKAVTAAETAIEKVTGLAAAMADYEDAVEAEKSADATKTAAAADEAGAKAAYDALQGSGTVVVDATDGTISASAKGSDDLAKPDSKGKLVLVTGVTEKTNPGITALLNAAQAHLNAKAAHTQANSDLTDAKIAVNELDDSNVAVDLTGKFTSTVVTPVDATDATPAEIAAEFAALKAAILAVDDSGTDLETAADEAIPAVTITFEQDSNGVWEVLVDGETAEDDDVLGDGKYDVSTELAALNTFQTDVDTAIEAAFAVTPAGDLVKALEDAKADVEAVEKFKEDIDAAFEAYEDAKELVSDLAELQTAIDNAEAWFGEDNNYAAPKNLQDTKTATGTDGDDIFMLSELAGNDSATIKKFGDKGTDYLFVGEGYKLVDLEGKAITTNKVGSTADLEIFWEKSGNDIKLYIETEAYGGDLLDTSEIIKITLSGVKDINDITLDGSFITAGV